MSKNQNSAKAGIIIGNIFSAFLILPALGALVMLPMAFDAPSSEKITINQIIINFVMFFPIVCILSIPLSWWQFKQSNTETAQLISIIPVLIVVILVIIGYMLGSG